MEYYNNDMNVLTHNNGRYGSEEQIENHQVHLVYHAASTEAIV